MSSADVGLPPAAPPSDGGAGAPFASHFRVDLYARWLRRVGAVLLDTGLLGGVAWLTAGDAGASPTLWAGVFSPDDGVVIGWPAWAAAAVILALQAWTGWTPGKLVVGIAAIRDRDGRPAGLLRTLGRALAHLLDAILFIGYLRPLWHRERRTFADSIARTVVVLRRPALPTTPRRVLTAAALALCLLGMALAGAVTGSFGGAVAMGTASCLPADPGPGGNAVSRFASVQIRGTETRDEERRLWTTRVLAHYFSWDARWTWNETTVPTGDLAIRTTVSAPDGEASFTELAGIDGRSSEITTLELQPDTAGLVSADHSVGGSAVSTLGGSVAITTELLLDGEPVATCTIPELTLEPTVWAH